MFQSYHDSLMINISPKDFCLLIPYDYFATSHSRSFLEYIH